MRYDIEDRNYISKKTEDLIMNHIMNKEHLHAVVISDYDKGVITPNLCKNLIDYCNANHIYTFVDPKIKNIDKYKNCFCFKPNLNEGEIISKETKIEDILKKIKTMLNSKHVILTCGDKGIFMNNITNHVTHSSPIEVVDVTGAGDTVLSVLVYVFLQKKNLFLATKIANYIAGKSVQKEGNYMTSIKDICEYYEIEKKMKNKENMFGKKEQENKIIFDYEIRKIKELSKKKNVVFTNGCFDIIHSAHIQNLKFAKAQGDYLVVGLNTDDSVRRLKGKERPINTQEERSSLLFV